MIRDNKHMWHIRVFKLFFERTIISLYKKYYPIGIRCSDYFKKKHFKNFDDTHEKWRDYKTRTNLKAKIKEKTSHHSNRLNEIENIRTKDIVATLWSNTATSFGILLSLIALFYTLKTAPSFPSSLGVIWNTIKITSIDMINPYSFGLWVLNLLLILKHVIYLLSPIIVSILLMPIVIRIILSYSAPEKYAEASLNQQTESGILTFVSLKMWEICNEFIIKVKSPKSIGPLEEIKDPVVKELKIKEVESRKSEIYVLSKCIKKYEQDYYKYYLNASTLIDSATKKLNLHKREFTHHILRFSPDILNSRVNSFKLSSDTLLDLCDTLLDLMNESKNLQQERFNSFIEVFNTHLKDLKSIYKEIESSMDKLLQLICHKDTHKYLIGIASITSTSRSLKLFLRGLSTIAKEMDILIQKDELENIRRNKIILFKKRNLQKRKERIEKKKRELTDKFKTLLFRSRAHYGMDLLISIENFCRKKSQDLELKKELEGLSHDEQLLLERLEKTPNILSSLQTIKKDYPDLNEGERNNKFQELLEEEVEILKEMRNDLRSFYKQDREVLLNNFETQLKILIKDKTKGKIYFCIFGYSRVISRVLKKVAKTINETKNLNIFIFKQKENLMLDTRIMRFELYKNEDYKHKIKKTFTASDEFLYSLVNKHDKVIFMCGAEAFSSKDKLLFHTNSYQLRIEKILSKFENSKQHKPQPDLWVLANDYKVFDELPSQNPLFGQHFLFDHYDDVDLYNFEEFKGDIHLIDDIKSSKVEYNEDEYNIENFRNFKRIHEGKELTKKPRIYPSSYLPNKNYRYRSFRR